MPVPGLDGVELIPAVHAVTLPAGVTIDAGGIGKGLAADLTARMLVDLGAEGAMVNLGGDLRAVGRPLADGWTITVPDPLHAERELLRLALGEGGVATTSRLLRRWSTTNAEAHHLIDPRTGRPADTDIVAVAAVAAEAWRAEAFAKAVFLGGCAVLDGLGASAHAVIVRADGTRWSSPGLEPTLR